MKSIDPKRLRNRQKKVQNAQFSTWQICLRMGRKVKSKSSLKKKSVDYKFDEQTGWTAAPARL